jgi:hypothetical protein
MVVCAETAAQKTMTKITVDVSKRTELQDMGNILVNLVLNVLSDGTASPLKSP